MPPSFPRRSCELHLVVLVFLLVVLSDVVRSRAVDLIDRHNWTLSLNNAAQEVQDCAGDGLGPDAHPPGTVDHLFLRIEGTSPPILFLHGGGRGVGRHTWFYNTLSKTWSNRTASPFARGNHSGVSVWDYEVVVFGGLDVVPVNSVWIFQMGVETWTEQTPVTGIAPGGRHDANVWRTPSVTGGGSVAESGFYVCGGKGFTSAYSCDTVFKFTLTGRVWSNVTVTLTATYPYPGKTTDGILSSITWVDYSPTDQRLFLFGGDSGVGHLSSLFSYDVVVAEWTLVSDGGTTASDVYVGDATPGVRGHSAYGVSGGYVLMYGGHGCYLGSCGRLGGLWVRGVSDASASVNAWVFLKLLASDVAEASSQGPVFSAPKTPGQRYKSEMASDGAGTIYLFGGLWSTGTGEGAGADLWRFSLPPDGEMKEPCSDPSLWGGVDCSTPKCDGVLATNATDVCSGRGTCLETHVCLCTQDTSLWGGTFCGIPRCDGFLATDAHVCNERGTCDANHECTCVNDTTNFGGDLCELPKCWGFLAGVAGVCGGHGTCDYNYALKVSACTCDAVHGGEVCQWGFCHGILSNETHVCSGHGLCSVPDGNCICDPDFSGARCEINMCYGITSASSLACCGHGKCVDKDVCSCYALYDGIDCRVPVCYAVPAANGSVCSGHGTCVAPDECTCEFEYKGDACETAYDDLVESGSMTLAITNGVVGFLIAAVLLCIFTLFVCWCRLTCVELPPEGKEQGKGKGDVDIELDDLGSGSGRPTAAARLAADTAQLEAREDEVAVLERQQAEKQDTYRQKLSRAVRREEAIASQEQKLQSDEKVLEEKKSHLVDLVQKQLFEEEKQRTKALEDTISEFRDLERVIAESRDHAANLNLMVKRRDVIIAKYEEFTKHLRSDGVGKVSSLNRDIKRGILQLEVGMGLREQAELERLDAEEPEVEKEPEPKKVPPQRPPPRAAAKGDDDDDVSGSGSESGSWSSEEEEEEEESSSSDEDDG